MKRFIWTAFASLAVAIVGVLWAADRRFLTIEKKRSAVNSTVAPESPRQGMAVSDSGVKIVQIPDDAIKAAWQDIQTVSPLVRQYIRYVWLRDGRRETLYDTSLAFNYVSRGEDIYKPIPASNGHLAKVDIRWYAPTNEDQNDWLKIWEEFVFDPSFSFFLTEQNADFQRKLEDLLPFEEVIVKSEVRIPARTETKTIYHKGGPYTYPDDSGFVTKPMPAGSYTVELKFREKVIPAVKKRERKKAQAVDVLRFNAPHLDQNTLLQLQATTQSAAPVVESGYFISRALTTIQDEKVFKKIFGGLYYQLRGIKRAKDVLGKDTKATDLDLFFEQLGIGNIKAGLGQEQLFNQLRSDQRMVMARSNITGKPREISSFQTPAARTVGSWGAITGDLADGNIDIGDRPFANLLTPRRDAREAIWPTRTGFNIFAIFNGQGDLVDEVPSTGDGKAIASDDTVPSPYVKRLQPAIGCIRCHQTEGSDGWKPITNNIQQLADLEGFDIFGDLSKRRGALDHQTIARLQGLYKGDFTDHLRRARDDNAKVTLRATGPWPDGSPDHTDICKVASRSLTDAFSDYNYKMVDAHTALLEMGLDVPADQAVTMFKSLTAIDPGPVPAAVYLEDTRLALVKAGIPVLRSDWALVYATAMERATLRMRKEKIR